MSRRVPCEASAGAGAREGGAGGAVRGGSHGAGGRKKGGHCGGVHDCYVQPVAAPWVMCMATGASVHHAAYMTALHAGGGGGTGGRDVGTAGGAACRGRGGRSAGPSSGRGVPMPRAAGERSFHAPMPGLFCGAVPLCVWLATHRAIVAHSSTEKLFCGAVSVQERSVEEQHRLDRLTAAAAEQARRKARSCRGRGAGGGAGGAGGGAGGGARQELERRTK